MSAILDRKLILVAGKGGVGRSTVAAAIAAACARRGRRTLLFEASAKDRFGDFFERPAVDSELTRLGDNLYAVNTNPAAALEEYGLMILRFKRIYKMVFENRVTKYFLRAIPGLDDYAVLGKAWYHTTETKSGRPRFDTLVFDLPASGHSLSMLRIPWVITDTVPEGPLTRDARTIKSLLTDQERTGLVLVTLAEEMPANEARELSAALSSELGIAPAHLVINQVYPERFAKGSSNRKIIDALAEAPPANPDLRAAFRHSEMVAHRSDLNSRYTAELAEEIAAPRTELPMLFAP
ncbi:MAG: ArsA family ATPase, partial [Deltaproteobacteria bacterium]|nr:ArsA family ATPase [Deltaproteobacteria bacterium]